MSLSFSPIGDVYGDMTIIGIVGKRKKAWLVYAKCTCGVIEKRVLRVMKQNVSRDKHPRCAQCFAVINPEIHKQKSFRHGMIGTRIYRIWNNMIARCYNKRQAGYKNYGGRGIRVCGRWHDFINFYNDNKDKYAANLEIDRIDVNGNYTPENIRWVTHRENARTKRMSLAEVDVRQIAAESNISINTIRHRIKAGWPVEMLTLPPTHHNSAIGLHSKHIYKRYGA